MVLRENLVRILARISESDDARSASSGLDWARVLAIPLIDRVASVAVGGCSLKQVEGEVQTK